MSRKDLVEIAKVAEQAERYDDMAKVRDPYKGLGTKIATCISTPYAIGTNSYLSVMPTEYEGSGRK